MVETSRNLGIFLLGDLPPTQIAETAQLVEEARFKELWIIEDYFMLSAFATSGIALQATKTIKVGIGAIANQVRHPAVAAMEATTLAGAFLGRFLNLGLGHGLPFWMKQLDLYPKSPLTSMTEAVRGIKRLAKGETLTEKGEYYSFDNIHLAHSAPDLRVMTAVVVPNPWISRRDRGRVADFGTCRATLRARSVRANCQSSRRRRSAAGIQSTDLCPRQRRSKFVGLPAQDAQGRCLLSRSPWANSAYGSLRRE